MRVQVIGTEMKSGSFEDPKTGREIQYNNLYLHCLKPNSYKSDGSFGFGSAPVSVKIKNTVEKVQSVFGSSVTQNDLEALIGSQVDLYYDEKGTIDSVYMVPQGA